jgi:hypothetical protein
MRLLDLSRAFVRPSRMVERVKRRRSAQGWSPNQGVDDSVLAWRAVEPELHKRGPLGAAMGVFTGGGGATGTLGMGTGGRLFSGSPALGGLINAEQSALRDAHDQRGEAASARLAPFEFACLEISERLSPDEAVRLRATGELPAWFRPELERRAREIRRELRRK